MLWMGAICLVLAGAAVGRRFPFPEAVVWRVLGYAAGFAPGVAALRPDPRVALLLILPPLVYARVGAPAVAGVPREPTSHRPSGIRPRPRPYRDRRRVGAEQERREDRRQMALGENEATRAALERLDTLGVDGKFARLARTPKEAATSSLPGAHRRGPPRPDRSRARIRELRRQGRLDERAVAGIERALDLRESLLS